MAPKKQSPFYNFMIKRQYELESKGHRFPRGLYDVSNYVSKEWENMSVEDKKKYETGNPSGQNADSLPGGSGVIAEEIKAAEERKKRSITRLLLSTSTNKLADMVFVLIDFNPYCINYNGDWVPAEIALVAFSLNAGVIDEFGTLIDPGTEMIKGLRRSFNKTRDELMLPNIPFGDPNDYLRVIDIIDLFMKKHTNSLSPGYLFCRQESTDVFQSCLNWLLKQTDLKNSFDLYPFEDLLMKLSTFNAELKNLTSDFDATTPQSLTPQNDASSFRKLKFGTPTERITFTDIAHVNSVLNSLLYASESQFQCLHHIKLFGGLINCSLAKLNRYANYAIASLVVNFGITERPSVHYPDSNMEREETNEHIKRLKQWARGAEYHSFQNPEEFQELLIKRAEKEPIFPATNTTNLDDLPLAMVPPMFRPQNPSTFKVQTITWI